MLYDELISIYKKEYNQVFESKDKDWKQKYDYENLEDLDYQLDELQQIDQLMLPIWVKVTKSRSLKLKRIV